MEKVIDENVVQAVQQSYGRCLSDGNVIDTFYDYFLNSSSDVKRKFEKTDFDQQNKLLKHGINLMIMFAADNFAGKSGLKRIQESHNRHKLNIEPKYYGLWKTNLIKAIAKHDRDFNDDLRKSWNQVLDYGINYITAGY